MKNILIVDDHQLVLDGLRLMIGNSPEFNIVGEAHNGLEAIEFLDKNQVDIVLMDLNMPEMNGKQASKKMKFLFPDLKIVILSMLSDIKVVKDLAKEGINGYLLKNSGQDEIMDALKSVINGENYFDQRVINLMLSGKKSDQVTSEAMNPSLSRRENEILKLIIEENTTAEIAGLLFISPGTVETHRRNMFSKLGVRNSAGLVSYAYEYGLLG